MTLTNLHVSSLGEIDSALITDPKHKTTQFTKTINSSVNVVHFGDIHVNLWRQNTTRNLQHITEKVYIHPFNGLTLSSG